MNLILLSSSGEFGMKGKIIQPVLEQDLLLEMAMAMAIDVLAECKGHCPKCGISIANSPVYRYSAS